MEKVIYYEMRINKSQTVFYYKIAGDYYVKIKEYCLEQVIGSVEFFALTYQAQKENLLQTLKKDKYAKAISAKKFKEVATKVQKQLNAFNLEKSP